MTKKDILLKDINNHIVDLDIAGYLKEEICSLCKYLNYYKLKNIYQNIDTMKDYLLFLDHHSTQQIHLLEYKEGLEIPQTEHDILYYLSKKGLEAVGYHKINQKIWEDHYNLSYIMQAVKGFLLLTADEFCNATPTRMSINKLLRAQKIKENK